MKRNAISYLLVLVVSIFALPQAHAWDRGEVMRFATLPAGATHPEGIAADFQGNFYVADFAVGGTASGVGQIVVLDRDGRTRRVLDISGSSTLLLGLDFHPITRALMVIDFGGGKVLRVDPDTGASSVFMTVSGASGLNALTFDAAGNVYVSDSAQGIIWKTGPGGGAATAWVTSPLLTTTGVPPFGANGLGFNKARNALFVANTGNDTIVRIPVTGGGAPGAPAVFVNSINGADGLIIDEDDNLWVAANQADEIVVVDPSGRVIAKLGDFHGIDRKGSPRGLLFPASLVRVGHYIYITNLALDLRLFGLPQAVDSQWAAEVKRHTISRIPARIPSVRNGGDDD
ncbi:MAG: SMP-30/gluconolactonase/LRE family protein [Burkholderiaceae bacterium]